MVGLSRRVVMRRESWTAMGGFVPNLVLAGLCGKPALNKAVAEDVSECFDSQFNEHERFGNQVSATAEARFRAALEVREARHENDRRGLVARESANLGAELESVHAGHLHIQEDDVVGMIGGHLERNVWILHADRL